MATIYHLLDLPSSKKENLQSALSTPEGFASWWTTGTEQPEEGVFRFRFPGNYHKDFKVIHKNGDHFEYECLEATPEWKGTRLDFTITQDNDKLVLHFKHQGWADQTPMFGVCNYHWALYLKSLKDFVENGKGNPTQL